MITEAYHSLSWKPSPHAMIYQSSLQVTAFASWYLVTFGTTSKIIFGPVEGEKPSITGFSTEYISGFHGDSSPFQIAGLFP